MRILNHRRILLVMVNINKNNYFISFIFVLTDNEMTESTTGTLLSLGKTEFDRRIKKK